jgi:hypothetical protein
MVYNSHGQPAARGPHAALEALQCGPSTDSEKRYFGAKSIRPLEKTQILALKMAIFQKCGPRVDLGWPWLVYKKKKIVNIIKLYIGLEMRQGSSFQQLHSSKKSNSHQKKRKRNTFPFP